MADWSPDEPISRKAMETPEAITEVVDADLVRTNQLAERQWRRRASSRAASPPESGRTN